MYFVGLIFYYFCFIWKHTCLFNFRLNNWWPCERSSCEISLDSTISFGGQCLCTLHIKSPLFRHGIWQDKWSIKLNCSLFYSRNWVSIIRYQHFWCCLTLLNSINIEFTSLTCYRLRVFMYEDLCMFPQGNEQTKMIDCELLSPSLHT